MKKKTKIEYYIIDKRILPTSIQNVIKVNDLVQFDGLSKNEAIKKIGISRSTYYKYRNFIKPFFESGTEKVFSISMSLRDRLGILSEVLQILSDDKMDILTIVQNIAVDGIAKLTISIKTNTSYLKHLEKTVEKINRLKGVTDLRILGN